jgi:hypothetical protein
MKNLNEKGVSLVELAITAAMIAGIGIISFNFSNFTRKETTAISEDIMNTIARFGAAKVITRDLSAAGPSFNFLNMKDDQDLPFFVLARSEFCANKFCERKLTLSIPEGQVRSQSLYLITTKGAGDEMLKFTIEPKSVFQNKTYAGINSAKDVNYRINKTTRPYSPWAKERILLLSSEVEYFDCLAPTQKADEGCRLSCNPAGSCNYVVKRPYRFLGVVAGDEVDLKPLSIPVAPGLLQTRYKICRPNKNLNCQETIDLTDGINDTKTFYQYLPYIPGLDNRTYLSPVEIVEYYLKRPNPQSPPHQNQLNRVKAKLVGTDLIFENPLILMSGVEAVEFSRKNISNPIIEYKIKKVRMRKSLK